MLLSFGVLIISIVSKSNISLALQHIELFHVCRISMIVELLTSVQLGILGILYFFKTFSTTEENQHFFQWILTIPSSEHSSFQITEKDTCNISRIFFFSTYKRWLSDSFCGAEKHFIIFAFKLNHKLLSISTWRYLICNLSVKYAYIYRSSHAEMFFKMGVLKIYGKLTRNTWVRVSSWQIWRQGIWIGQKKRLGVKCSSC